MEEEIQTTMGIHDHLLHHPKTSMNISRKFKAPKFQKRKKVVIDEENDDEGDEVVNGDDDDKVGIERRIIALQRLVPGGESLEIDKLFEETAGYILALQGQVKTMKVLTNIFEGLDKENRRLGG
ncbi:hypothetical protein ACHQM5_018125 [Ranunculus cassubicifolius]